MHSAKQPLNTWKFWYLLMLFAQGGIHVASFETEAIGTVDNFYEK